MRNKTEDVRMLVWDVLQIIPRPYGEDVIEDVCLKIEGDRELLKRYDELCGALGKLVVNQSIGRDTKKITEGKTLREVAATRSKIIRNYTKLDL